MMQFLLHVTCSYISHAYILLFNIFENVWDFSDCLSFSPSLLFTLVVSMAPKRKSTLARNPLRFGASSSSDLTLSHIWFRDDDAVKAFSEKFSRQGIHLERQIILSDFADTNLHSVIHSKGGSHCVMPRSPILSCWSRSSTPTCTRLIGQYLFSSLAFKVRAFLSHRS